MENFFQANGIWLAIITFIPGLILLIKIVIKSREDIEGMDWFFGSATVIVFSVFLLVISFVVAGSVNQNWKLFGIFYLISLGLLFFGYVFYKIGKNKTLAMDRLD